ncbi:MAG: LamG domain-containing protein [Nitrosarchaeum sp.]|nr:LamG domain-containing protein [Nitrosarchaeum sp.]
MGLSHSPSLVMNGLVLALDAGNSKSYPGSGTTWTDLSGNSNTGTLTNGPTYSSANGGSLSFDGVNDYIDFPTTLSNQFSSKSITVFTFAKISSVVSKNTLLSFNGAFNFFLPGSRLGPTQQLYWDSTTSWKGGTTTSWTTNQWYQLAWTIDSSRNILFYINGILDYSSTILVDFSPTNNTAVRIGFANAGEYATGNISNTQIYNRALFAAEVSQNFNALRGRYGI